MEKFWHPVNERLDGVLYHQRILIELGNTEEEIQEAMSKVAQEIYEERRSAKLAELGLSEEDFEDDW